MSSLISKFERELLDAHIDISTSEVLESEEGTLSVTSQIGVFRILLSALFGISGVYLLCVPFIHTPFSNPFFVIPVLVCSPVLMALSILFGFAVSCKQFEQVPKIARRSVQLFRLKREQDTPLCEHGFVYLWSKWGDEDRPALWFYVDINDHTELGFCVAWKYEIARQFAQQVARFLSYDFVDKVSVDHKIRTGLEQ